jgi:hypothetical protein
VPSSSRSQLITTVTITEPSPVVVSNSYFILYP